MTSDIMESSMLCTKIQGKDGESANRQEICSDALRVQVYASRLPTSLSEFCKKRRSFRDGGRHFDT